MTRTSGSNPAVAEGMNNPLDPFQQATRNGHIKANVSVGNNISTNAAGTGRRFAKLGLSRYEPNASFGNALSSGANINFLMTGSVSEEIQDMWIRLKITNTGVLLNSAHRVHSLNNALTLQWNNHTTSATSTFSGIIAVGEYATPAAFAAAVQVFLDAARTAMSFGRVISYNALGYLSLDATTDVESFRLSGPGTALISSDGIQKDYIINGLTNTITQVATGAPFVQNRACILHPGLLAQLEDKLRGSNTDHTFPPIAIKYLMYRAWERGQAENAAPLVGFNFDDDSDPNWPKWNLQNPFLDDIQTRLDYDNPLVIQRGATKELILPIPTLLAQGLCKIKSGKIQPQIQIKFNRDECAARCTYDAVSNLTLDEIDIYSCGMDLDQEGKQKAAAYFNSTTTMIPVYIDQILQKNLDLSDGIFTQITLPHMGRFKEFAVQTYIKAQNWQGPGTADYARINGIYPGLPAVSADEVYTWNTPTEYTLIDNSGSPVGITQLDDIISRYLAVIAHDFTDYVNATNQLLIRFSTGWNCSWFLHEEDGGIWFEPTFSIRLRYDNSSFNGYSDQGGTAGTPNANSFPGLYPCIFFGCKHAVVVQERGYSNIYLQQ